MLDVTKWSTVLLLYTGGQEKDPILCTCQRQIKNSESFIQYKWIAEYEQFVLFAQRTVAGRASEDER